ncbi:MAG: HD-GYP domain-containing protein [Desulfotomaculaceae bacterium]|nr:HD-GYP domain-containing protein [Desulfotomaculaceae bacterium]
MGKVNISSLEPGMKIGRTIYGARGEMLIRKGVELTPGHIRKLAQLEVSFVFIDDESAPGTVIPKIVVKDVIADQTRLAAVQQVKNILLETKESGRLVIDPQTVYKTVNNFTDELLSSSSIMVNLVELRSQDDYTFAHSVNVCVLALMTGITLELDKKELGVLGVGALLHDLGKVKVPDEILNKPGTLTKEEFKIMKKHTYYGHELIQRAKGFEDTHALIACQHHECYNGSGYPLGIKENEFNEFSQIVAISDKFDALTANRVYRNAFPPHEAYEMCAASGNFWFKDHIVKAFLHNIAAYPSGTFIELNDRRVATVIDTPKGLSMFPRVRVLFNKNRRLLSAPQEIPLSEQSDLYISRSLSTKEVQSLLESQG